MAIPAAGITRRSRDEMVRDASRTARRAEAAPAACPELLEGQRLLAAFFGGEPERFWTTQRTDARWRAFLEDSEVVGACRDAAAIAAVAASLPSVSLSVSHLRVLVGLDDRGAISVLAGEAVERGWSVRELREARRATHPTSRGRPRSTAAERCLAHLRAARAELAAAPGRAVRTVEERRQAIERAKAEAEAIVRALERAARELPAER